jgi:hypothetical protein
MCNSSHLFNGDLTIHIYLIVNITIYYVHIIRDILIEACVKAMLSRFKIRDRKEFVRADLKIIKSVIKTCGKYTQEEYDKYCFAKFVFRASSKSKFKQHYIFLIAVQSKKWHQMF